MDTVSYTGFAFKSDGREIDGWVGSSDFRRFWGSDYERAERSKHLERQEESRIGGLKAEIFDCGDRESENMVFSIRTLDVGAEVAV